VFILIGVGARVMMVLVSVLLVATLVLVVLRLISVGFGGALCIKYCIINRECLCPGVHHHRNVWRTLIWQEKINFLAFTTTEMYGGH
jgi:hypothetical protein